MTLTLEAMLIRCWCFLLLVLQARSWQDPESDLPLAYTYSAARVLLHEDTVATTVWVSMQSAVAVILPLSVRGAGADGDHGLGCFVLLPVRRTCRRAAT